jgi:hypothetical protein
VGLAHPGGAVPLPPQGVPSGPEPAARPPDSPRNRRQSAQPGAGRERNDDTTPAENDLFDCPADRAALLWIPHLGARNHGGVPRPAAGSSSGARCVKARPLLHDAAVVGHFEYGMNLVNRCRRRSRCRDGIPTNRVMRAGIVTDCIRCIGYSDRLARSRSGSPATVARPCRRQRRAGGGSRRSPGPG